MNQLMYQKPISFLLRICLFLLPLGANAELKDGRYFQAIASGGSIVDSLWFRAGGERHPLFVSEIFRSGDYPYDSAEAIVFYGDRVDEAGNPLAEAVAAVPPGATRLLLLFNKLSTPDAHGRSYAVAVLKDDVREFAFGSFQFINASDRNLAIDIGGNRFLLGQFERQTIPVATSKNGGGVNLQIVAQDMGSEWKTCYSNSWGHRSDMRTLAFIINSTVKEGGIKILRYRQSEPSVDR